MITLVANEVYRSPEPGPEDYALIKAGFANDVKLDGNPQKEIAALYPPVAVISEPISFWQMHFKWWAMPASKLDYIVDLIARIAKPTLVHCLEGRDRTGLVIAAYRVKYMNPPWSPEDAMAEAIKLGYHRILNQGLNETWKNWLKERAS